MTQPRGDVHGAQTSGNHSEECAGQVRLQVIDSANVQSFGEAQPLVQYDYVAEQIPTHTPNPALGDAILPGTAKSGSDGFCAVLFDGRDDRCRELRVPVED